MDFYVTQTFLDNYLLILTICEAIFGLIAVVANVCFGANLIFRKKLHDQTQILLLNITIVDFALGVLYLYHCIVQVVFSFDAAPYNICIFALAPFAWLSLVLPCLTIVGIRSRMIQVTAYGDTTGGQITSEPWKMKAALASLWVGSLIGTVCSFSFDTLLPMSRVSCLFPLSVGRGVLVSYLLFTSCATLLIVFEYGKLMVQLLLGGELHKTTHLEDSDKFSVSLNSFNFASIDKKLIRNIIIVAGLYMGCWMPMNFIVFYCLKNYQENYANNLTKALIHFVWLLPLLHSAVSPLIYISLDVDICKLRPLRRGKGVKRKRSRSVHDGLMVSAVTLALPSILMVGREPDNFDNGLTNHGYVSEFM